MQTLNFAEGAIGLGVDELRWPNAVRPGDVLTVETEILDLRPSRSKPGYGIIRLRNVTTNQGGEIVQTMLANAMVPRRSETTDYRLTGQQDQTNMRDYTKIEAWRLGDDLTVAVYERTRSLPERRCMGLEPIATSCLFSSG